MKNSKSSTFLIELIVAIMIFSLCSTICLRIFVKSYSLSRETEILNKSMTLCTSAAELFYGYDGHLSDLQREMDIHKYSQQSDSGISLYYDKNFEDCREYDSAYTLTVTTRRDGDLLYGSIKMTRISDSKEIYALKCDLYSPVKDNSGNSTDVTAEPVSEGGVL